LANDILLMTNSSATIAVSIRFPFDLVENMNCSLQQRFAL
jgi:hypothetical protein